MSEVTVDTEKRRERARGRPLTKLYERFPFIHPSVTGDKLTKSCENCGNDNGNEEANEMSVRGRVENRGSLSPIKSIPITVKIICGDKGQTEKVVSKDFRLNTPNELYVYDYHVEFEPAIKSRLMRKTLIMQHKEAFNECFLFDGLSNVKSIRKLEFEETNFFATRGNDDVLIRIRVKRVSSIPWAHPKLLRLYNSQMRRNLHLPNLNLILRHYIGRNIRDKVSEQNLELLQGVLAAINYYNVILIGNNVFNIHLDTVYEKLKEILYLDSAGIHDNARRELAGSIVLTNYNNNTYRINDIDFTKTPLSTFKQKQRVISLKDYFRERYSINIRYERQPLLIAIPSVRHHKFEQTQQLLLIPELCVITGLSESLRTDFNVLKVMTKCNQSEQQNLDGFMRFVTTDPILRKEMAQWGVEFDNNLVEGGARRFDFEKISLQNDTLTADTRLVPNTEYFGKYIGGKAMFSAVRITDWIILFTQSNKGIVDEFAHTLIRVCRPLGVQLNRPQVQSLDNDRPATFVDACKAIHFKMQIVVVILPNINIERYDTIKKIFCCHLPTASQIIVQRTLSMKQNLMSVCTKIGNQLACKLGPVACALNIPVKDLMVAGFDEHCFAGQRGRAIGGFVCSTNATLTKWYSRVSYHTSHEELSENFSTNFSNGLKRYYEINKKLPQSVVVYRNGVSERDIEYVFTNELKKIEDAIQIIGAAAQDIKLSFLIVTNLVNIQFFQRVGGKQYNKTIQGSILDTVATRQERYDFYLISQSVRQGTVTPTMYNIIKDDNNWTPHQHQQLAYKLTHLFNNWIGTIRVPAPCYYAHKLALITGKALQREPKTCIKI